MGREGYNHSNCKLCPCLSEIDGSHGLVKNNAIKIFAVITEELETLCNYVCYVIHLSYTNVIQEMKTKGKQYAALILQKIRNIYGQVVGNGLLSDRNNNLSHFVVSTYRKLILTYVWRLLTANEQYKDNNTQACINTFEIMYPFSKIINCVK